MLTTDELLTHLPDERARAVHEWLTSPVASCATCDAPVRPVDPRALVKVDGKERVLHLNCQS